MPIVNSTGTVLDKTALTALTAPVVVPDKLKLNEAIYETFTEPGSATPNDGKRLKFHAGQIVTQKQIDDLYA